MTADRAELTVRKRRHIDVCLDGDVGFEGLTTGLERYRLPYNALTQTNLDGIDLSVEFLGARLRAPILVGAMTGGAQLSGTINRNLAAAAQQLGIGMMLGSQRVMLNSAFGERAAASFAVRDVAPDVLLFGNIGLSQLTKDALPDIVQALDRVGANALAVHTNPLQEAVQHNGDTDFAGSLDRLHDLTDMLGYPVLLKEVGHGIGATAVAQLLRLTGDSPVAAIDVAVPGVRHGREWSNWSATAKCATPIWPTGGYRPHKPYRKCAQRCPASRWSLPAGYERAWTLPKRWPWAPTWWPWPGRCWRLRSSPRRRRRPGCSGSSTSFASACMAAARTICMPCVPSA